MEKTNKSGGFLNVAISFGAVLLTGVVAWKTTSTTALIPTVLFLTRPLLGTQGRHQVIGRRQIIQSGNQWADHCPQN